MNVEIGTEAELVLEKEHINEIFVAVQSVLLGQYEYLSHTFTYTIAPRQELPHQDWNFQLTGSLLDSKTTPTSFP